MTYQTANRTLTLTLALIFIAIACNSSNPLQDLIGDWEVQASAPKQRLNYALEPDGRIKVTFPDQANYTIYAQLQPGDVRKFSGTFVTIDNGTEVGHGTVQIEISADKQTLSITEQYSDEQQSRTGVLTRPAK